MLADKGVVLSSYVKYAFMRDEHGGLTSIKNGDRFCILQAVYSFTTTPTEDMWFSMLDPPSWEK